MKNNLMEKVKRECKNLGNKIDENKVFLGLYVILLATVGALAYKDIQSNKTLIKQYINRVFHNGPAVTEKYKPLADLSVSKSTENDTQWINDYVYINQAINNMWGPNQ